MSNYLIPPGTRDILPDEMRELRALSTALLETFHRFGYGEVWTPTMEYEDVLVQGDEQREFLQAGVELIGAPAPGGTVEVLEVLCATLDAAGLPRSRIGLGDAGLYRSLLEAMAIAPEPRERMLAALE